MAVPNSYPPPGPPYQTAPQQPQPPPSQPTQQSPEKPSRKSRTFSFRSDKSRRNSHKIDLHETHKEKEAKRLHSKADPTLAMQEAEPAEVAQVRSSIVPLRSIQHKDAYGNPIVDPDRSNPTRSRWERPLETIRSFEAAIDGGYNRRSIVPRADDGPASWGPSRRASYYETTGYNGRYAYNGGYYGSRPNSVLYSAGADGSAPELRPNPMRYRDSYYEHQPGYGGYPPQGYNTRPRWLRMPPPDQHYGAPYRQPSPYGYTRQPSPGNPLPSNHRSYETVTTSSGSGSSAEPAGYQTDPTSSDNSSIERGQSASQRKPEPSAEYGMGFSQAQGAPYQSQGNSYQSQPNFSSSSPVLTSTSNSSPANGVYQTNNAYAVDYSNQAPPPVPVKDQGAVLRKPVASNPVKDVQPEKPAQPEKRKSWLFRRFSRRG